MGTEDKRMSKSHSSAMEEVLRFLPERIRSILSITGLDKLDGIEEIRLRAGKPVIVQRYNAEYFLRRDGHLVSVPEGAYIIGQDEIQIALELMSRNSIYAFQDEIRNGYITLRGGHRVGIAGKVIMENRDIKSIKEVSGLNIRISRQIKGCAEAIIPHILNRYGNVLNTLVVSPPQCGKTTILRDMARILSDGLPALKFKGVKVGIVDERSEIAACYKGIAQNDVGIRTDVLDGCPKSLGMIMMIRSLSPHVIITDEIGNEGDRQSIMQVLNAGIKMIASAHGYNISELKSRREVLSLIENKVFERYIVLSSREGPGTVEEIIDGTTMQIISRGVVKCL